MLTKEASYPGCFRQIIILPEWCEPDKMLRQLSMTNTKLWLTNE
jgi:hypothetical protein